MESLRRSGEEQCEKMRQLLERVGELERGAAGGMGRAAPVTEARVISTRAAKGMGRVAIIPVGGQQVRLAVRPKPGHGQTRGSPELEFEFEIFCAVDAGDHESLPRVCGEQRQSRC